MGGLFSALHIHCSFYDILIHVFTESDQSSAPGVEPYFTNAAVQQAAEACALL